MIAALLALLPPGSRHRILAHTAMNVAGIIIRAISVVLLVPLLGALFSPHPADAWPWTVFLLGITVVGWIVDASAARLGFGLGFRPLSNGQRTLADRISGTKLTWFTGENTATTRQAVAATGPDLVGMIVYLVTPLAGAIVLPAAIGIALLFIAWPLGLVALAGVPVLIGAFWGAGRLGRTADHVAAKTNSALTERIVEFARTQQALRAARRVEPERSHAGAALAAQHGAATRLLLMQIPGQLIFGLASQLTLLALAGMTVLLAIRGSLTAPEAIALIVVIVRYLEPFTVLAELSPGIQTAADTLRRIRTVLQAPANPEGPEHNQWVRPPRVELRAVSFAYPAGEEQSSSSPVINDLDLVLEPGTTTAIVGPSGSGKSTILALLSGLHQPGAGSILVDDIELGQLSVDSRRELVSMVFQHPYLFDGAIGDNILAGSPTAEPKTVQQVATLAQVNPILDRLPHGWQTRVGEAGTSLSGGERQRVSIARALLKPAPLLLVDEATSALDTENERAIIAALAKDPIPRTRVIVAHRLQSIRAADRVIFLEDGRIVEDGTVEELLAAGGRFAEFWRQQDAATGWRLGLR